MNITIKQYLVLYCGDKVREVTGGVTLSLRLFAFSFDWLAGSPIGNSKPASAGFISHSRNGSARMQNV